MPIEITNVDGPAASEREGSGHNVSDTTTPNVGNPVLTDSQLRSSDYFEFRGDGAFAVAFLYGICHLGIIFVPNSLFWDDWLIANISPEMLFDMFDKTGSGVWVGWLLNAIITNGLFLSRVLAYLFYGVATVCVFSLLRRHTPVGGDWAFVVAGLFAILPLNTARVSLISMPYALNYCTFFLAWLFLLDRRKLLSGSLFFFSFFTASTLVFFALPIAHLYAKTQSRISIRGVVRFGLGNAGILAIPFIFFALKRSFFVPYGNYAGYNQNFYWDGLATRFVRSFDDFLPYEIQWGYVLFLLIPVWLMSRRLSLTLDRKLPFSFALFGIGAVALVLAMFPYLIVGHIPTFWEWTSRHQLLMPLGIALLMAGFLGVLPNAIRTVAFCILISLCAAANLAHYVSVWKDANKQEKLLVEMKKLPNPVEITLYLFDDKTPNALRRHYRQYEWTGMLKRIHGDETRFGIGIQEAPNYARGEYDKLFVAQYLASGHRRTSTAALLVEVKKVRPPNCRAFCVANYELHAKPVLNETKP